MTTEIERGSSPAAEVTDRIRLFGLGSAGTTERVRPLRISTMQEMLLLEAMMRGTGGLDRNQFAQNPWGFPFIPFPEPAGVFNGHHRVLIPDGTSINIGQHPIYWIDESLTTPTEDEEKDPARWCVRMFYLIMGFGLWTQELQWISAPCMKLQVQSIGSVEYENYIKGFESGLSEVRYTVNDLLVPLDVIERESRKAIAECLRLQRTAWTAYRTEQLAAYEYSQRLITDLEFTPWKGLSEELGTLCSEIAQAASENLSLSLWIDPLYDCIGKIVRFFDTLEANNVVLSAVSLRTQSASVNEYNRIYNGIAQYQEKIVESGYEYQLNDAANKMISNSTDVSDPDHFAKLYRVAENIYLNLERRLRLQTVNYARILNDQDPFATYTEMEIIHSDEGNIGQDNLPSLRSIASRY